MKPFRPAALAGAVAIGLVVATGAQAQPDLLAGSWRIERIDRTPVPARTRPRTTAVFSDGEVKGISGCNHYWGTYSVSGSAIHIHVEGMTTMGCILPWDPNAMRREQRLLDLFGVADDVSLHRKRLVLKAAGKEVVALTHAP